MNIRVPKLITICVSMLLISMSTLTQASPVLKLVLTGSFEQNYDNVSQALDANHFYVIFEPNIGNSLSNFKERWGEEYNQNGYEEIRSLVFCNPWYVNQVLNKDPEMAALCPLSVTLLHKNNQTEVMFLRPSKLNPQSPAQEILRELENDIIKALKQAQTTE
jgi:uncharacterized protein (DUF302 family)